jgi:murein DD-endopeptidase MepM/ murein hydrolase activator NlpD
VQPLVAAGQAVARGSPLGVLAAGHAGCPTGACLHWGLRRGETYLDPLVLLRPPRVRLLPWG